MTHFPVLVVTENGTSIEVEKALQPYHEFECTGIQDKYVQNIDITKGIKEDWMQFGKNQSFLQYIKDCCFDKTLEAGSQPELDGYHKYGWIEIDEFEEVIKVIDRTNPKKQWDYWTIGGRWSGMLLKRDGTQVDQAQNKDIDFETMKIQSGNKAELDWKDFNSLFNKEIPGFVKISDYVDKSKNISEAREFYYGQALIDAVNKSRYAEELKFGGRIEKYLVSLHEFIANAQDKAIGFDAILIDNQWCESGSTGWFGISTKTDPCWAETKIEILKSVKPHQYLTVVDCHI